MARVADENPDIPVKGTEEIEEEKEKLETGKKRDPKANNVFDNPDAPAGTLVEDTAGVAHFGDPTDLTVDSEPDHARELTYDPEIHARTVTPEVEVDPAT
ncbi:MAG: hypothetical protein R3324_11780, partial [Halobacteriales archaeon]|nr:hypothetical protein [Halobacteriales archaeon]